jgi:AcrR family transcriptional regulator
MARRGDQLTEHILLIAKDVFLEMGYERASMDVVAARAHTSKRSVYAHFKSKERLFLAVIELVRGLFLTRLRMPGDYSDQPADALVMFCGRYLETLLYLRSIQMIRVSMAEAERFPKQAAQYFDVLLTQVHTRLSAYLKATYGLSARTSADAAHRLLAQVIYPRFTRALFGMDALAKSIDRGAIAPEFDLKPIRKSVADFIESLPKH